MKTMKKMKPTPGPWRAEERHLPRSRDNGPAWYVRADGAPGALPSLKPVATVFTEANARLIASLPGLLAVCADILREHDTNGGRVSIEPLRAEVARATGQEGN